MAASSLPTGGGGTNTPSYGSGVAVRNDWAVRRLRRPTLFGYRSSSSSQSLGSLYQSVSRKANDVRDIREFPDSGAFDLPLSYSTYVAPADQSARSVLNFGRAPGLTVSARK